VSRNGQVALHRSRMLPWIRLFVCRLLRFKVNGGPMGEPALTALFFADYIIVEEQTHKKSAIGLFDRFMSSQFPISFPPWSIFAGVTIDRSISNETLRANKKVNQIVGCNLAALAVILLCAGTPPGDARREPGYHRDIRWLAYPSTNPRRPHLD